MQLSLSIEAKLLTGGTLLMASLTLLSTATASPLAHGPLQSRGNPFALYTHCPSADHLLRDQRNFPPARYIDVWRWPSLERYCITSPGGRCDCVGKTAGDRPTCRIGIDYITQVWHEAPLTRHCENLCVCRSIVLSLSQEPPVAVNNPFVDEIY